MVFVVEKICLDSDVCIAILKNSEKTEIINKIIENKEVHTTAINVFELLLRKTNLDIVENFLSKLKILSMDDFVAKKASILHKILQQKGEIIEIRDLFIAATCIVNDCSLFTFNYNHFERIKELKLIRV